MKRKTLLFASSLLFPIFGLGDAHAYMWPLISETGIYELSQTYAQLEEDEDSSFGRFLHTGLDIVESKGECVRAIEEGVVHDIVYDGNYSQVSIINDATDRGFKYVHLGESSINVCVKQYVQKGCKIGEIAEWTNEPEKEHLHLERIELPAGTVGLANNFDTIGNPLPLLYNYPDEQSPLIHPMDSWGDFRFVNADSEEEDLYPMDLRNKVRVIVRVSDSMNSQTWHTMPYSTVLELFHPGNTNAIATWSVVLDGPIDTILKYKPQILYADDSVALGEDRKFYIPVTQTDNDKEIGESDLGLAWNTLETTPGPAGDDSAEPLYPNGTYLLKLTVTDVFGNEKTSGRVVKINNEPN